MLFFIMSDIVTLIFLLLARSVVEVIAYIGPVLPVIGIHMFFRHLWFGIFHWASFKTLPTVHPWPVKVATVFLNPGASPYFSISLAENHGKQGYATHRALHNLVI